MVSLGARSKWATRADPGTAKPSPLAGEGGERRSRSPGEGEAASTASAAPSNEPRVAQSPRNPKRDTARRLRNTMTDAERKLWSLLRNRKLSGCKFRRQVPVGPYVADFLSFESRLIVEADGGQHADSETDMDRDAWLTNQGFRIVRFWNSDIAENPDGVVSRLSELACTNRQTAEDIIR